jgi:hypothetical protein
VNTQASYSPTVEVPVGLAAETPFEVDPVVSITPGRQLLGSLTEGHAIDVFVGILRWVGTTLLPNEKLELGNGNTAGCIRELRATSKPPTQYDTIHLKHFSPPPAFGAGVSDKVRNSLTVSSLN